MRTDVHRPAELVPENYEYLYAWDSGTPGSLVGIAQSDAWREWHSKGPVSENVSSAQCTHCGAWIRYVALMRYIPTGQYLYVGETCLANRFERSSADFHALRKAAQLDRERQRILTAWVDFQNVHGEVDWASLFASTNEFVVDVLRKGRQYGSLSDRQLEAIVRAVARDNEPPAPEETKVDAPSGKVTFTGTVVSRKLHEGYYGSTIKLTIKVETDKGIWLCWVTEPKALDANRGDIVTMTATLTVSDRDASFAFGKRPTKASVVVPAIELADALAGQPTDRDRSRRCADCGEWGELTGHMGCHFPQDH